MVRQVGEAAATTPGKRSLAMESFAAALRAIPATICDNAGASRQLHSGTAHQDKYARHYPVPESFFQLALCAFLRCDNAGALEHPWPAHSSVHSIGLTPLHQPGIILIGTLLAQADDCATSGWKLCRAEVQRVPAACCIVA